VIPHLEHPDQADASLPNAEKWAARIPAPTYAIDDETAMTAISVVGHRPDRLRGALEAVPAVRRRAPA
jgi:hypothetical protein